MANYVKCSCCGSFAEESELETVTLVIQKHKSCNLDTLFKPAQATGNAKNVPYWPPTTSTEPMPYGDRADKASAIIRELEGKPLPQEGNITIGNER